MAVCFFSKSFFLRKIPNRRVAEGSELFCYPASTFLWAGPGAEVTLLLHPQPSPHSPSYPFCNVMAYTVFLLRSTLTPSSFSSPLVSGPGAPNLCPIKDLSGCFVPHMSPVREFYILSTRAEPTPTLCWIPRGARAASHRGAGNGFPGAHPAIRL